jgi:tryptophan-rich sensory protein
MLGVIFMKKQMQNGVLYGALLCGVLCAGASLLVRAWAGAPYKGIDSMDIGALIPPVWLMALAWFCWYLVLGGVLGVILAGHGARSADAWRGATFFVLMLGLGFVWYGLFFCRYAMGLGILLTAFLLVLCVLCALSWQGLSLVCGVVMYLHALWLLYMLILQLACVFCT